MMPANRRGSPEAVAKRRAARSLNALFMTTTPGNLDGRTQKRKERLVRELQQGRNGETLKALDVLMHAHELLQLGETLTSLRRLKPKTPATPELSDEATSLIRKTQELYGFNPDSWKLLGVDLARLGVEVGHFEPSETPDEPTRAKTVIRRKKAARKKPASGTKSKGRARTRAAR